MRNIVSLQLNHLLISTSVVPRLWHNFVTADPRFVHLWFKGSKNVHGTHTSVHIPFRSPPVCVRTAPEAAGGHSRRLTFNLSPSTEDIPVLRSFMQIVRSPVSVDKRQGKRKEGAPPPDCHTQTCTLRDKHTHTKCHLQSGRGNLWWFSLLFMY